VQWTEMHEHPPLQFSDVISPGPKSPRAKTTWERRKSGSRGSVKIFRTRVTGYPDAGGQTDGVGSSAKHWRITTGKERCACASLEAKKLFSAALKIAAVFLSGFLPSKRKELGGRT
jgi:hypothetical protein